MKISIITATYNSAATVRDTIESVLRQTYQDVEYIVKDGWSIDDTLSICQEYETQFKGRMRIISCPDKGLYDAMNVGIEVVADFEQLLRLIYIHNIEVKYIEKDFVTMRLGGASTSGWLSHVNIMNDHLRAFRQNGIRNNVFRLAMRYIEKLREYK